MAQSGEADSGLNANTASGLCYVFIPLCSIAFLLISPYSRNPVVRFHALQAIFFSLAMGVVWTAFFVVSMILSLVGIGIILLLVSPLVSLGIFIWYVINVIHVFKGQRWVMPVVGGWAARMAA